MELWEYWFIEKYGFDSYMDLLQVIVEVLFGVASLVVIGYVIYLIVTNSDEEKDEV